MSLLRVIWKLSRFVFCGCSRVFDHYRFFCFQCRLLTLHAANMIDKLGSKGAFKHIAMIKIAAPKMSCDVIDRAIQFFGAAGVSQVLNLSL
jgi:hypothetical protein